MSIFHSTVISEWNEDNFVIRSRFVATLISVLSTLYETFINDYGKGPLYEFMIKSENPTAKQKSWISLQILVSTVLLFVIYVHVKIELHKRRNPLGTL